MSIINNYHILLPKIGYGRFSKVYKAIDLRNNEYVSVKVIPKEDNLNLKILSNEIEIISTLDHPNIIKFIDKFEDQNFIYIVLELCVCNLRSIIAQPRNERNVRSIMLQIRDGLQYLYQNKIFHRDLKPENILINEDGIIKISDFGFSVKYQNYDEEFTKFCGTPVYLGPEILSFQKYGIKSDLWSIGVILYELFFKNLPFGKPKSVEVLYSIICNSKIKVSGISESGRELLYGLLEFDANKRTEWTNFLNHPWFSIEDFLPDLNVIKEKVNFEEKENVEKIEDKELEIEQNIKENINLKPLRKSSHLNLIEDYDKLDTIEIKKLRNFDLIENYLHN